MRRIKRTLPNAKKPKRKKLRNTVRWILYFILIFLAFVTANAGDYTKPLLLIPIALCISSVSGMAVSGGIGILCGFLLDISCGTLLGYHAILLFFICMGISVMYDRLMQQRFLNMVIFTFFASFVVTGLDYIFLYAIWGYENVFGIYWGYSLPCLAYTVVSSMIYYPIFYGIHHFFLPVRKRKVQKTVRPMEEE